MAPASPGPFDRLGTSLEALTVRIMGHPVGRRVVSGLVLLATLWVVAALLAPVVVVVLFIAGMDSRALGMLLILTLGLWAAVAFFFLWVRRLACDTAGFSRDLRRAMSAAQAGDPKARWTLVKAYRGQRSGLPRDLAQAAWWLKQLAEAGDPKAAWELAGQLERGEGVVRDREQAARWRRRAAEGGHALARHRVAREAEEAQGD